MLGSVPIGRLAGDPVLLGVGQRRPEAVENVCGINGGEARVALKVLSGDGAFPVRSVSLPATIGRPTGSSGLMPAASNGLFGSTLLSRKHAQLYATVDVAGGGKGGVWVTDLGSSNGTYLNGILLKAHTPYRVSDGDLLQFGADDDPGAGQKPLVLQVRGNQRAGEELASSLSSLSSSSAFLGPAEPPRRAAAAFSPGRILQEARSLLSRSAARVPSGSLADLPASASSMLYNSYTSTAWSPTAAQRAQELSSGLIALAQRLVEAAEGAKLDVPPRPNALSDLHRSVECALQLHAQARGLRSDRTGDTLSQRPCLPDALRVVRTYETLFCLLALLFILYIFLR